MRRLMKRIAHALAAVSLSLSSLLFLDPKPALSPFLATIVRYLRLTAGALSNFTAFFGLLGGLLGLFFNAPSAMVAGWAAFLLSAGHIRRVTNSTPGLSRRRQETSDQTAGLSIRRWRWRLPAVPVPRWQRDVSFYAPPGREQPLTCDIWSPAEDIAPSGLAFVYFHGGGWRTLHKDVLTRTFFRQLAAQGHLVMDASYRLYPEVDMSQMAGDARQAVAWMKANAPRYGADPECVVVSGGSAGGHLALLTAYTAGLPELIPEDLQGADHSVRAAVSFYPPVDLQAYVAYRGYRSFALGPVAIPGRREVLAHLLGGQAEEIPEKYALFSPLSHVGEGCPPTLLIAPGNDDIVPMEPVRELHRRLLAAGVPAYLAEFPGCEHGFDLALPRYSPAAMAAVADVQRFLTSILP